MILLGSQQNENDENEYVKKDHFSYILWDNYGNYSVTANATIYVKKSLIVTRYIINKFIHFIVTNYLYLFQII